MHNRRKALIYVSDGYDFNPFQDARLGLMDPSSPFAQNQLAQSQNAAAGRGGESDGTDPVDPTSDTQSRQNETVRRRRPGARAAGELTRPANRANVTIYTIDPRGLVGPLSDLDEQVDPQQWAEFVRKSQDSLRVIAEETGGIAVVNQNDFGKALKRIDAEIERLLRARVLLEESGSAPEEPAARGQGEAAGRQSDLPAGIFDQAAARPGVIHEEVGRSIPLVGVRLAGRGISPALSGRSSPLAASSNAGRLIRGAFGAGPMKDTARHARRGWCGYGGGRGSRRTCLFPRHTKLPGSSPLRGTGR